MKLLKKYNKLILQDSRVTFSKTFPLGETEMNIFYLLISQVHPKDKASKEYIIPLADIEKLVGRKQNIVALMQACVELRQRTVVLENVLINGVKKDFSISGLINTAEKTEGKEEIMFTIPKTVCEFYINLKEQYNKFELENMLRIKGRHAKRLYIILCAFQDTGWYQSSLEELIDILTAKKVDKSGKETKRKYSAGDFKKWVLLRAKEEIETTTELRFDIVGVKNGRKVVAYRFDIQSEKPKLDEAYEGNDNFLRLKKDYGLSKEQAKEVVDHVSEEMIGMFFHQMQLLKLNGGVKSNIGAASVSTLKRSFPELKL